MRIALGYIREIHLRVHCIVLSYQTMKDLSETN